MAYEARTQAYYIQLQHCSPSRGIYLRWLSSDGNREGWLFTGENDTKTSLDSASSYSPADSSTQVALQRPGQVAVTVRAGNLTTAQHLALSTILTSPMVYIQELNGSLTPVMVAENATSSRSTSDGKHVLALDILPPAANALSN